MEVRVPQGRIRYSRFLEWCRAAQWAGYTVEDFFRFNGDYQSFIVARYMVESQIEAVVALDQYKRIK